MFRVTDVNDPKLDTNVAELQTLDRRVQRQVVDDIFGQYVGLARGRARHQRQSDGAGASAQQQPHAADTN